MFLGLSRLVFLCQIWPNIFVLKNKQDKWKKIITTFVGQTGSKCKSKLFDFLNENIFRSTGECVTVFFLFSFLFTLALTV